MNYKSFRIDIVSTLKVGINGWPKQVEFQAPSEIENLDNLKAVYEAWKAGEAFWFKMSVKQVAIHEKSIADDERQGKQVTVPRKERKDAGGTHRKSTKRKKGAEPFIEEDEEEQQRPKKKRASKKVPDIAAAEPGPSKGKGKEKRVGNKKKLPVEVEEEEEQPARFNDDDDDDDGLADGDDEYLGESSGTFAGDRNGERLDGVDLLDNSNDSDDGGSD